jgi:hypothetical protein
MVDHLIGQIGQQKFQAMIFSNQIFKSKNGYPKNQMSIGR